MLACRPDLQITGIDYRDVSRPGKVIQGDVMVVQLEPQSFDAIVSISAIEHIGLQAYGDPIAEDGDTQTMRRCVEWLKPNGRMYLDVPYRTDGPYVCYPRKHRAYDEAAVQSRLIVPGFKEVARYVTPAFHADAPYIALVLEKV